MTAVNIAAELQRTARAQAGAADPSASVWVSANAGTGKTHVLTMRVLRLMLAGTLPERILCLTYTKAAAAEMSKRVFATLAKWVTLPDTHLAEELAKLTGASPALADLTRARTLFATAIETPGGLKVQTIHAFCERLLQRFPLEAGIPAGFTILDDETARTLRRESIDLVLSRASREPSSPLGHALRFAVAYAADDRFDEVLAATLPHKAWLAQAVAMDGLQGTTDFAAAEAMFRRAFGVRPGVTAHAIDQDIATCLAPADMTRARDILSGGSVNDVKAAAKLSAALASPSLTGKADSLISFFLKADGEPRASLITKKLAGEHPDLDDTLQRAQARCATLAAERASLQAVTATVALHRLADAVHQAYADAKGRRAALDFEDLIEHTSNLLASGTNAAAEWVLYKLDGGLDHLLVDESQDTSPAQWDVVAALAREFFSGDGTRAEPRTLFAVGDEKQSIYSFQGAVPEKFAAMGDTFAGLARNAGQAWHDVPLDVSFRTVEPLLIAVDATFADGRRTPGVRGSAKPVRHIAKREGQAGVVEIWPTEADSETPSDDVWSPFSEGKGTAPAQRLAARIASTIRDWLDRGEMLVSENRPIRAGDIIVLVRKRAPFAAPMVAELKKRAIPVAGADRLPLTEQIGVQDLLTLGDFLTLPEDDLALATLLKSPMFGLNDDDLLVLAPGRKGTLWKALLDNAEVNARYAPAAETLKRWRKTADFMPPFEFFADLLDNQGMRKALLARLGPDAADAIDEFLNLALTYDDSASPSLAGFVHWLRDDTRVVKRDMEQGRDEVRVMTVHGAKGLEAPIVFLPDTCSTATAGNNGGGPLAMPAMPRPGPAQAFVWQVKGMRNLPPIADAKAAHAAKDRAERDRLLYVAMTRARDRLYVAGFEGKRGRDAGCWYDQIVEGLTGLAEPAETQQGTVWRLASAQTAPHDKPKHELAVATPDIALPPWALARVTRETQLTVPLAPSRLAPYETDAEGEPAPAPPPIDKLAEPPPLTPAALADKSRFLRGTLTHALLEHLPSFLPSVWPKIAKAFIAERGAGLSARTQASIVSEAMAILADATFGPLFGPGSSAEVPIVAEIPRPSGDGPALRLSGQIDRLVDNGREVLIVDYKTNRPPPRSLDQVADAYIYQLAAYRLALAQIFGAKPIRAAILWTDGPRIMEIPRDLLDSYARRLWTLERSSP
jgi:ATP-dependent helicase/nuclease subunit A